MSNDPVKKDTQFKVRQCILAGQAVQAAIRSSDFPAGLAGFEVNLAQLYGALENLKLHEQVEAAYREGWRLGAERAVCKDGWLDEDWEASDAKAALEGAE